MKYPKFHCFVNPYSLNATCPPTLGYRVHEAQKEMGRRILNEALRAMVNAERRGKASVELKPISTVMSSFLKIMKDRGKAIAFYSNCHLGVVYLLYMVLIHGFTYKKILMDSLVFWEKIQPGLCLRS